MASFSDLCAIDEQPQRHFTAKIAKGAKGAKECKGRHQAKKIGSMRLDPEFTGFSSLPSRLLALFAVRVPCSVIGSCCELRLAWR